MRKVGNDSSPLPAIFFLLNLLIVSYTFVLVFGMMIITKICIGICNGFIFVFVFTIISISLLPGITVGFVFAFVFVIVFVFTARFEHRASDEGRFRNIFFAHFSAFLC